MAFAYDFQAMIAAAMAVSDRPPPVALAAVMPGPSALPALATTSERLACRTEKLNAMIVAAGPTKRDAIALRWVVAGCRACGTCADLAGA